MSGARSGESPAAVPPRKKRRKRLSRRAPPSRRQSRQDRAFLQSRSHCPAAPPCRRPAQPDAPAGRPDRPTPQERPRIPRRGGGMQTRKSALARSAPQKGLRAVSGQKVRNGGAQFRRAALLGPLKNVEKRKEMSPGKAGGFSQTDKTLEYQHTRYAALVRAASRKRSSACCP